MRTQTLNLRARTNEDFIFTRDFSQIAIAYDIPASVIRMHARISAASQAVEYGWASDSSEDGKVEFDPQTGFCVFSAPAAQMAMMPVALRYDCRIELQDGSKKAPFAGGLGFTRGVTSRGGDLSPSTLALGDTVEVLGEFSPVALPVSQTAILEAVRAAAARVTPEGLPAQFAALSPADCALVSQLLFAAIPEIVDGVVPVGGGQVVFDGSGFLTRAGGGEVPLGFTSDSWLVSLVESLPLGDQRAIAQMIVGALPNMTTDVVPVRTGQACFSRSRFCVRAR
ncbi:hypothetical protein GJ654_18880 [Rhodoblastus acidophilus]|uniref:Uncharacterized protein n=1 Tax=Rhodoblastus acidophilus TaxID=1074 RepID=A0A6N8DRG4_RHOAC|nr:hypothetical protein [Rhodoblastus acidophilus]MCW2276394.1 hypothetical protein [Rhodoblastus acidophilus]MTV33049.1 hypothetical protein [Rhodoblastus acidophilus]